jgi:hypothetical protein
MAKLGARGRIMTTNYTYTIYDADPSVAGGCAWPSHQDIPIEGDDIETVCAAVEDEMRSVGRACGAYESGERLWADVYEDDGTIARTLTVTLDVTNRHDE